MNFFMLWLRIKASRKKNHLPGGKPKSVHKLPSIKKVRSKLEMLRSYYDGNVASITTDVLLVSPYDTDLDMLGEERRYVSRCNWVDSEGKAQMKHIQKRINRIGRSLRHVAVFNVKSEDQMRSIIELKKEFKWNGKVCFDEDVDAGLKLMMIHLASAHHIGIHS